MGVPGWGCRSRPVWAASGCGGDGLGGRGGSTPGWGGGADVHLLVSSRLTVPSPGGQGTPVLGLLASPALRMVGHGAPLR